MNIHRPSVILSVAALVLLGLSSCGPGSEIKAGKAVDKGIAQIEAHGIDLVNMSVTVTSTANTTIVLPAGTRFLSSAGDTQNMISAGSIRFVFTNAGPGSPQTLTQQVPVYCINRFLEAPTAVSQFSVSYSEETDPIRKLVTCMEDQAADHRAKQLAVWMVSDHLLDLSPAELAEKFVDEAEKKARLHMTGPELADVMAKAEPNTPSEVLESIRNMGPEQIGELIEEMRPMFRKSAEAEVKRYAEQSRPLLEHCGYDLSKSRFFRE